MPIVAAAAVPHPPIILPEIGKGEEVKIQKTADAYAEAMRFLADSQPETVVVISPHADLYAGCFQISPGKSAWGDFARYGAPRAGVEVDYDEGYAAAIAAEAVKLGLPTENKDENTRELDHGTLIPLVFLMHQTADFKVVRIGLSGLSLQDHYRLGQCIAAAAGEKKVAVIGSGDLSHKLKADGPYGFAPEGPVLDEAITASLASGNFGALLEIDPALADAGAECGLRAFIMMAGALDGRPVEAKLLSYEGTFGVGYAVATFRPFGEDETRRFLAEKEAAARREMLKKQADEDIYVALARLSMETFVSTGRRATVPGSLPAELTGQRAGVFVSLHKNGDLRGCIGTIAPVQRCIAEEIIQNAVSSATEDPRFSPVTADELDFIEINVDVLGAPEPVASEAELDPKRYGVIVESEGRRGLLLPDLEGVETVAQQVDIARRKAGIAVDAPLSLQRFEVIRHT